MAKKLNEIHRTATFAWSPGQQLPLIAAGTVSGTLDDSFSNASELELFQLDLRNSSSQEGLSPVGKVSTNARFNTLGWGYATADKPHGVIAGGMENGELELWNPAAILEKKSPEEALILRNSTHTGPLRGLDFNKIQPNLLASAGANSEVYIWDLTNPGKPYSPGQRSSKLDDITSVAWNCQVQHILATSSANGYTVVWDLRNRKEIMTLAGQGIGGMAGGRRGIGAIAWHPDVATQIVTASEDDNNPVITLWDLRHAHSPEKTLAGHSKGIMGVSWCQQDSDLLLSCGKDCKTLCWNPGNGELLGEVSQSTNWTFDVEWCPRNPDLLASASFDGKINVYSIQGAGSEGANAPAAETTPAYADDPFSAAIMAAQPPSQSFTLKHPPKWLRRSVGASFAFGGKLVSFNNKAGQAAAQVAANMPPGAAPAPQTIPRKVTVATVVADPEIVKRSDELESAIDQQALEKLIEDRRQQCANSKDADNLQNWDVLKTLFAENAREQLMQHLGFRKEDVVTAQPTATEETAATTTAATTEPAADEQVEKEAPAAEATEASAEPVTNGAAEQEKTTATEAELPSAAVSAVPQEPLELYPEGSSETDKSITKSIVMGDFESAVQLCLSSDRLSDALLLAICGGSDLLARTQKQYFERQAKKTSYLRLLQSIVDQDLNAVVQNTSLEEWTSVVVMLCTFARSEDFGPLCETLGDRLQEAWSSAAKDNQSDKANELRRNATLCYLAAGNLEKVANIWIIEQEEGKSKENKDEVYALSLHNLIEKITVFRKAIEFVDPGLTGEQQETYQLARLYDKYCEYAELMATQGKLDVARRYLELTPSNYRESAVDRLSGIRERVYIASGRGGEIKAPKFPIASSIPTAESATPSAAPFQQTGYTPEPTTFQQPGYNQKYTPMAPNAYEPTPAAAPAPAPVPAVPAVPQPTQPYGYDRQYMPPGPSVPQPPQPYGYDAQYGAPPMGTTAAPPPPPPKGRSSGTSSPAVSHKPAATGAWNDPPNIANPNVTKSPAAAPVAPRRVTSPFPNMPAPSTFAAAPPQPFMQQNVAQPAPPPPPMNAVPPPPMMRQQQQQAPPPPPPTQQQPLPPPPAMGYVPQQPQQMPQPTGYLPQQQQVPPPMGHVPQQPPPMNAAPPPSGGHASPRGPPAAPRAASPAPAKPAAPPAVPEKKRHPKDGRSHIPPEHRPIHQILVNELQQARQRSPPAQKKILDDTERRFNTLFDQLNNGEVSESVIQPMLSLVQALQKRDYETAQRIHVDLVTTRYEECGSWLMGVKRLIDNAKANA